MTKPGEDALGVHVGVVEVGQGVKLGRGVAVAGNVIVGEGLTVEVLAMGGASWEGVA
jgi:hypothetical protein